MEQNLTAEQFDVFAFAGQSNADGHFFRRDGDTSQLLGREVFQNEIFEQTGFQADVINTAIGGSGSNNNVLTPFTTGTNFWWNLETNEPGPLLLDAIATIHEGLQAGQDLDGLIWAQGEEDADAIFYGANPTRTINDLVESTQAIFAQFRAEFGEDLQIFVQELGDFPATLPGTANGFELVRDAQLEIIQADLNTHLAADADVNGIELLDDNIHYTTESHGILAEQLADSVVDILSDDDLNLVGTNGADVLNGGEGADTISGDRGADTITGGNGTDILNGNRGADTINGGNGADTINGGNGTDLLNGNAGADTINGGNGRDTINGGNGTDTVNGGNSADTINGGNGADLLNGDRGADTINGGNGDDHLNGGNGRDTLDGGADNDLLTGGNGADTFVFTEGDGFDRITDFGLGNDKIDLSDFDFAHFNQLNLVEQNNTVFIFLDENTSIELSGVNDIDELSADDFIL